MKTSILVFIVTVFLLGCSSGSDSENTDPADETQDYTWSILSPYGGFVSAIKYHPSNPGEVWASGDDSSGLFKSTNSGSTWTQLTTTPVNHATYSIIFDPTDSDIIYTPNHFGRGIFKSTNAGVTWSTYTSGLPSTQDANQRIRDLEVIPNSNQTVLVTTYAGLYRSTNGGQSFTAVSSATFTGNSDTSFTALTVGSNSHVYLGSTQGRVYKSTDAGVTWSEITAGTWTYPVTDLAVTDNALYMAFFDGMITKSTNFTSPTGFVNDTSGTPDIVSGFYVKLIAVQGANASSDKLYIGSGVNGVDSRWGFHFSDDGGATLNKRVSGLDDSSVFSLDVNPLNSSEIIIGTVNNGIFKSTNEGVSWSQASTGVNAHAILAFFENPSDTSHLVFSSAAGIDGTSMAFESTDNGSSWSEITFFEDKSIRSLHMYSSNTLLAGTWNHGIYKTTTGSSGSWSQVSSLGAIVNKITQDNASSSTLYASAYEPDAHGDLGVWVSSDSGDSWTKKFPAGAVNVLSHPTNANEALALTGGIYATTNSFTTYAEIGLAAEAPAQIVFSAAFIPGTSTSLIAGTSAGKLYRTDNYVASGSGVSWSEISIPVTDAHISGIIPITATTWYVSAFNADHTITASTTPGILKTTDAGVTWEFVHDGLFPSHIPYVIKPSGLSNTINVGLWGSGLYRLEFN